MPRRADNPQAQAFAEVAWEPISADLSANQKARILGVEAALWSELVRNEEYFEFMLYPRLAAVAEVAWHMQANSTPADFATCVVPHIARWKALGRTVRSGAWDAFKYMKH